MLLLAMLLVPCSPCLDPAAALPARTCCLPALDEGVGSVCGQGLHIGGGGQGKRENC